MWDERIIWMAVAIKVLFTSIVLDLSMIFNFAFLTGAGTVLGNSTNQLEIHLRNCGN